MLISRFIKRRFSILALVSVVTVSFCFIPYGKTGLLNAAAASHAGMQGPAPHDNQKPEKHGCHSDLQISNEQQVSCPHCATLASSALNKAGLQISKITIDHTISQSFDTSSYVSRSLSTIKVRPPGLKRPIHVINSTYLI